MLNNVVSKSKLSCLNAGWYKPATFCASQGLFNTLIEMLFNIGNKSNELTAKLNHQIQVQVLQTGTSKKG